MSWYKKAETLLVHLNQEDNSSLNNVFAFGLNWYKRGLIKTAGYDYTDVLGNQISSMMSHLQPLVGKVVGADKSIAALKTRLNVWNKAQQSRDEVAMREARAAAFIALRKAQETINSQGNPQTAQNPVMRDVQQTLTTAPDWQAFGKSGDISQKVSLVPGQQFNGGKPGPDTWIKIGIKLHPEQYYDKKPGYTKNPAGEVVEQTMGDWCKVGIPPRDPNIYIRGTQEAWNKFLGISGWVFANDATIKAFKFPQPLPSEKQFDPNFAEQQEEKPKGMKPLEVKQVPPSGKNAKAKGGLQLIFDVRNPSFRPDFPQIRDYIYQVDQKKQSSVFSPGTVEIDWTNGVIVIPDLVPKDDVMSLAIMQLKNKLQQLGYANTAGIGSIVTELTGIKPKEAYNETRNEMLAQPRTHAKTQGAIKANLKPQGPKLASRFHGLAQELGIDPTQPMSSEQYEQILSRAYGGKPAPEQLDPQTGKPIPSGIPYGPDNWHGPFGSRTTPHQRKAQAEGMRFVASRTASVLADEPGSGKTAQAIVGADAVREDGQKVLVVTPGVLLQENWVGDDAKGPMFFCGHDRNQVAVISNSQDYEAAMADPSKIWIVLRDTTLQQTGGDMQKLVQGISAASKQKKFSSLIIDEIQRYKNSDSIRFEQMQNAISPYDIDHRIGLTGTPADNTPDDIFSQMALLRHGQLYTNDGKRNWTQVQGVVGFSRQFLGGEELSTGIQLTDDEKKKSPEEQEQIIATKWAHKASGVLQWVQQLDKNKKEDILDLFTSTYLRRNKEDIRPEIAQEAPLDNTGKIEVPADPQIPFRRDIKTLEKIANKKAEATAEHAKALLLANPQQKIFIASRFISSANLIAKLINEKMGAKGIAVAVTSKFAAPLMHPSGPDGRVGPKMNDEEARAHVAEEFRKDNGRLNHHDDVLRAVVYTLDLGAVGLNFSNATEAIINDMAWNPSTNLQAEYRVHRIDSKKPVKINYTMMKGTYDEEMYKRVNKKKEINKGMSDLMRAAQQEKDPKARLALANKFVDDAIENILIDAGLSPKQQRWFDDNLQKAFQGQPVETFEQMVRREKQAENQLLFDNMPQWTHLPTSMGIADQYRAAALETLEDHFGEEWTRLPPEVLKPFLHQAFARQEQVAA